MVGVNYSSVADFDKSNEYLNKYLELTQANEADPRRPDAIYMIASNNYGKLEKETAGIDKEKLDEIAAKAKAHTDIVPNLQKVVDSTARDVIKEQAYMKMGNYYYMSREIDQAISTYEALIAKFPNSRDIASFKDFLGKLKDIKTKQEEAKKQSKKSSKKKRR
jgi:tetratricopeptide (TPR) repeat protein